MCVCVCVCMCWCVLVHVRPRGRNKWGDGAKKKEDDWRSEGSIGVTLMGTELCCELNELIFKRLLCIFPFIERIAILTSCSLCETKPYPMMIGFGKRSDGKIEPIASTSPSHTTLAYAAHCFPLLAKIEELAQRKINRWLNSNGLCHWIFYQWESNSRAVSEFQFSFRLRYVPAFYSLHLYAS